MMNLKKLASLLNLSISTVSKALRDSHEISAETKKRVMDMARELNYEPNPYAGSLRKAKSRTIAVVVPEIVNNFFVYAIKGIQMAAHAKGYHVLIYITNENVVYEKESVLQMANGRVDGLLISLSDHFNDYSHIKMLHEKDLPIVLFDRVTKDLEVSTVTSDNYESAYNGTVHLITQGCRRIAHCVVSDMISIGIDRLSGYKKALQDHGIEVNPDWIIHCSNDFKQDGELIEKVLCGPVAPDALFTSIEIHALMAYEICRKHQISIPRQLKVLSFSNLPTAHLLQPSLSTITQPAFDIGQEAALQLITALDKPARFVPENVVIKSVLTVRESTQQ